MRAGRLLLAVVAMLHLHVVVKTCGGTTGMGMVLFLEILLLVVNGLRRRLLLVVVVLGCHLLLHVSLRDLSGLLLLLIRCRMLGVWWNNVIRLLVGAVVANQLQVRQNVANVVVGASRNVRAASVILLLLLLLLLLVFHFDHVGVPNFLVAHKLLIVHAHHLWLLLLLLLRVMLLGRLLLRFLLHLLLLLLLSLLVMNVLLLDVLRVHLLLMLMVVMRRLMLL